ncbi:DUF6634 family protein [Methylobacterium sp. 275MFSha3.1]|uniref:DUF6634 family protein n=1 Tax=Methylobacterium sp. 275MFSha3.1 TaxID=1502746 RepID=UPI000B855162|nr:DUF6634 family protein [Methylobacterium sp. 275MFSha3.1]
MSIVHRVESPSPELARIAAKYRRLAEDLERAARGEHPSIDDLRDAPLLMEWKVHLTPVPYLEGIVLGHPLIPDGQVCRTSELLLIEHRGGYARTLSRYYRLLPRPDGGDGR